MLDCNLLLVVPATSATTEISFSALIHMKTYLRSTIGRLNSVLVLQYSTILEYCRKLIQSKGTQKRGYIKDKVREIARFLIQARQSSGMNRLCLNDCINTEQFTVHVSAVKVLTGFDQKNCII